jgi:hypothetical protein
MKKTFEGPVGEIDEERVRPEKSGPPPTEPLKFLRPVKFPNRGAAAALLAAFPAPTLAPVDLDGSATDPVVALLPSPPPTAAADSSRPSTVWNTTWICSTEPGCICTTDPNANPPEKPDPFSCNCVAVVPDSTCSSCGAPMTEIDCDTGKAVSP